MEGYYFLMGVVAWLQIPHSLDQSPTFPAWLWAAP